MLNEELNKERERPKEGTDPAIGRFLQADSVVMPVSLYGMNRYMYVEGSPVRWNDPSGNLKVGGTLGRIGQQFLTSPIKFVGNGLAAIGSVAVGAAVGATLGFTGVIGMGIGWAAMGVAYGMVTNPKAFMHKPLEATGAYALAGIDFGYSMIANPLKGRPLPSVSTRDGATIIKNSGFINDFEESGVAASASGPVVRMRTGAGRLTLNHELEHVNQWYGGRVNQVGFNLGIPKVEYEAELKSGTNSYDTFSRLYCVGLINEQVMGNVLKANVINNAGLSRGIDFAIENYVWENPSPSITQKQNFCMFQFYKEFL